MATLTEIRNKANAVLTNFWQLLEQKQDAYFAKHGKYFQLLLTNEVIDGVDTTFQVRHPSDEKNLIDVDFDFALPIPFSISVDEWIGKATLDNESGAGYSVTARIKLLDDRVFERTRKNNGEDTNWFEVNLTIP